jgi:hypothetical protein
MPVEHLTGGPQKVYGTNLPFFGKSFPLETRPDLVQQSRRG